MKTYQLAFLASIILASPRMNNVDALVLAGVIQVVAFIFWWRDK